MTRSWRRKERFLVGSGDASAGEVSGQHVQQRPWRGDDTPARVGFRGAEDMTAVFSAGQLLRYFDCPGEEIDAFDSQTGDFTPPETEQRPQVHHRRVVGAYLVSESGELVRCDHPPGFLFGRWQFDVPAWGTGDHVCVDRVIEHGAEHAETAADTPGLQPPGPSRH